MKKSIKAKVLFEYNGKLFKNDKAIVKLIIKINDISELPKFIENLKKEIYCKGMFDNKNLFLDIFNTKDFQPPLCRFIFKRNSFKNGTNTEFDMESLEKEFLDNLTIKVLEVNFNYKLEE